MLGRTLLLLMLVSTVALGGCGGSDGESAAPDPMPTATPTSDAATDLPADDPCSLLSAEDVEGLAGQRLDGAPATIADQLPVCQWGDVERVGVQAGVTDAGTWAEALPEVVASLEGSDLLDADDQRVLAAAAERIEGGETVAPDEACDLFSRLIEANGRPAGSDVTINVVPSADDPRAITGQACRDGRFATVLVVRPDLSGSEEEAEAVEQALRRVLGGAA